MVNIESTVDFHLHEQDPGAIVGYSLARSLRGFDGRCGLIEGNLTYGEALGRKIFPLIQETGNNSPLILNVGDGFGDNSYGMNKYLLQAGISPEFVHLDLSSMLLREQQEKNPAVKPVQGDAENLPFQSKKFDGVVCNEVIADLQTVVLPTKDLLEVLDLFDNVLGDLNREQIRTILVLHSLGDQKNIDDLVELVRVFRDYQLTRPKASNNYQEETAFNLGAILFLEEAARVLKPGGWAWISEFGNTWPKSVKLAGHHREWSIKFGHLIQAANALGFNVGINQLADDLGINKETWYIDHGEDNDYYSLSLADAMRIYPNYYKVVKYIARLDRNNLKRQRRELRTMVERFGIQITTVKPDENSTFNTEIVQLFNMADQVRNFYSLTVKKPS